MVDVYDRQGKIIEHHSFGGIEVIGLGTGIEEYSKYTEPACIENMLYCINRALDTKSPQVELYSIRSPNTGNRIDRIAHILPNKDGQTVSALISTINYQAMCEVQDGVIKNFRHSPLFKMPFNPTGYESAAGVAKTMTDADCEKFVRYIKDGISGYFSYTPKHFGYRFPRMARIDPLGKDSCLMKFYDTQPPRI